MTNWINVKDFVPKTTEFKLVKIIIVSKNHCNSVKHTIAYYNDENKWIEDFGSEDIEYIENGVPVVYVEAWKDITL